MHVSEVRNRVSQWLGSVGGPQAGLTLDSDGRCFIVAEDGIVLAVSCPDQSQAVIVLAHLVNVPIPLSADLYEEILALNLRVEFTAGAQVFFDKQVRALGLMASTEVVTLDAMSFGNLLIRFKEKAREVREFMEALLYQADGPFPAARDTRTEQAGMPAQARARAES